MRARIPGMRRLAIVLAFTIFASCRGEHGAAEPPAKSTPAAPVRKAAAAPPAAAPKPNHSTPEQCAGDGSYEQAVDCLRIASALRFTFDEGRGELKRPTPGSERVTFEVAKGDARGSWFAESRASGIVWTRDGKRIAAAPDYLERLFQRVTLFPDPQKKEGTPQVALRDESTVRYTFTDANSGEAYDVVVNLKTGAMEKVTVGKSVILFSK